MIVLGTFPPRLDYTGLIPWGLFLLAVRYLSRVVRLLDKVADKVEDHAERLGRVEGALAQRGIIERRRFAGELELDEG